MRHNQWKYIEPSKGASYNPKTNIELGNDPGGLLYNLATDPGEKTNLVKSRPEVVKTMQAKLEAIRQAERTRPASPGEKGESK